MPKLSKEKMPEEALYKSLDLKSSGVIRLMEYLVEEHRRALSAYDEYFNDLKVFRRAIASKPATKVKTFPWPGASNIIIPLIRISGDAVKARIVNTLLAPKPFWSISAPSGSFADFAKPTERFLEWAKTSDLNIVDAVEMISDQAVYLGKCPIKIYWSEIVKKIRTYSKKTKEVTNLLHVITDSPVIEPILLENWLEPWGLEESNKKPWNSQRVFKRTSDLIEMEKMGLCSNSAEIRSRILTRLPESMIELGELRKMAWADTEVATLYETHVEFDIDNDGFREELIALWDFETTLPLYVKYNYFFHGLRPLEMIYYLRHGDSRSSADGLAQLLWPLQEALSTFVNQRTDNITIANTKIWKGRKNSVKKGEQIWPGKVILLEEPEKDLVGESLGEVSPSSFTHESMLRDYGERLSGIADPQLGREFDNPRVAATTTLSILQEGNRRFDMIIRIMRETFSRIGLRVLQLYQQFEPRVPLEQVLSTEDELYVRQLLDMEPDEIAKNITIQVNTSTASVNKETQRQGLIALNQLITGFYSQILDVAMKVMMNPQMPDEIKDMIIDMSQTSYRTILEIVQTFDITNPEQYLVDVAEALNYVRGGGGIADIESDIRAGLTNFGGLVDNQGGANSAGTQFPMAQSSGAEGGGQGVRPDILSAVASASQIAK